MRLFVSALGWAGALGALTVLLFAAAPSEAGSVFTVRDVPLDATAASSAEARTLAIARGQRDALVTLLKRLTVVDESALPARPSDSAIASMVAGFSIANELVAPTRYRADLTVDFNPESVRRLLRDGGTPFAETESKPVLVVPVFSQGGVATVWDDANPWRAAWLARPVRGGLVPLVLPLGDIIDLATLDVEQALASDREALDTLVERYGTTEVVVALAHAPAASTVPADSGFDLALSVRRIGTGGERRVDDRVAGAAGEPRAAVFQRAVERIVSGLERTWKSANLVNFERESAGLLLGVPLGGPAGGLREWVAVRDRLERLPVVSSVMLSDLTRERARLTLRYFGTSEQLALALEQANLVLSFDPDGWILRTREAEVRAGQAADRVAAEAAEARATAAAEAEAAAAVESAAEAGRGGRDSITEERLPEAESPPGTDRSDVSTP